MSRPLKRKVSPITHATAIRIVEKAASDWNDTREHINKIADVLSGCGEVDISSIEPPSLRRALLEKFPSWHETGWCSRERGVL